MPTVQLKIYRAATRREAGFTLLELVFSVVLLTTLLGGIATAFVSIQSSFDEEVSEAQLQLRSRGAMDRLVRLAGRAITSDSAFAILPATAGVGARGLQYRNFLAPDSNGEPTYDNSLQVFLIGDDLVGTAPCSGVVVGRGPNLNAIYQACAGPDDLLGTADDDFSVEFVAGTPAVELLVPDWLAPSTGSMLEIAPEPGSGGRLMKITLRTNFMQANGNFLRTADLVLEERVALKW